MQKCVVALAQLIPNIFRKDVREQYTVFACYLRLLGELLGTKDSRGGDQSPALSISCTNTRWPARVIEELSNHKKLLIPFVVSLGLQRLWIV